VSKMGSGATVLSAEQIHSEDHEQMMLVAVAAKLKATGTSSGVPDLFIPAWRLWVEMKRVKCGSLSAEQKDWITYLEGCGYSCIVGKGAEDAKAKISAFLEKNKDS